MSTTTQLTLKLIEAAEILGLRKEDLNTARELSDHGEYGLALDTIVTQLYEFDLEIDQGFYDLVQNMAKRMQISEEEYSFMTSKIRSNI